MAEYSGSAIVLQWIWSGGTVSMQGDTRRLVINEAGNPIVATAGSDANQVRLAGIGDANMSWEGVAQDGAGGSVNAAAFRKNNVGTVIASPAGTAAGSPKYTLPAIISTSNIQVPYNDVVTGSVEWLNNTAGGLALSYY